MTLPIDNIKESLLAKLGKGNIVITSPTGSGKSTRVPIWAAALGRVLVVEPRRVACRALATYLASKNNEPVGDFVGYQVRGERRLSGSTRVCFVTPGVALGILSEPTSFPFDVVIIDEYHERTMELDLLLALCLRMGKLRLAVMSATIDGERIAHHVNGVHVEAKGRSFPIEVNYLGSHTLPTREALVERVLEGLLMLSSTEGDILVFLPGKQEIENVRAAVQRHDGLADYVCLPLHSQLSLDGQSAVFKSGARRRIILSTNVAEASVTVPRVRAVVDTGLVRQTLYRGGRGYLTLTAVSQASADQRAGRAGRVGPGVCIRLWSRAGRLAPKAKPEILRESVSWMVLRAASLGWLLESLPLLDQPPAHSLEGARQYLNEIGAIDESGLATSVGRAMTQIPVDLSFARWLVAAQHEDCLSDMIALVSTLSTRRHYLRPGADLDAHPIWRPVVTRPQL